MPPDPDGAARARKRLGLRPQRELQGRERHAGAQIGS